MSSTSSTERIIENFPHPTITPIVGKPTFETISPVHLKLNTNAASIYSNRGNGQLGLIFLTLKPEVHDTISSVQFIPPTNPGPNPTIAPNSTGAQIAEIRRRHKESYDEWMRYDQTDKALKKLLLAAVDESYVRSLRDKCWAY